jgi:hypothetical protein
MKIFSSPMHIYKYKPYILRQPVLAPFEPFSVLIMGNVSYFLLMWCRAMFLRLLPDGPLKRPLFWIDLSFWWIFINFPKNFSGVSEDSKKSWENIEILISILSRSMELCKILMLRNDASVGANKAENEPLGKIVKRGSLQCHRWWIGRSRLFRSWQWPPASSSAMAACFWFVQSSWLSVCNCNSAENTVVMIWHKCRRIFYISCRSFLRLSCSSGYSTGDIPLVIFTGWNLRTIQVLKFLQFCPNGDIQFWNLRTIQVLKFLQFCVLFASATLDFSWISIFWHFLLRFFTKHI